MSADHTSAHLSYDQFGLLNELKNLKQPLIVLENYAAAIGAVMTRNQVVSKEQCPAAISSAAKSKLFLRSHSAQKTLFSEDEKNPRMSLPIYAWKELSKYSTRRAAFDKCTAKQMFAIGKQPRILTCILPHSKA